MSKLKAKSAPNQSDPRLAAAKLAKQWKLHAKRMDLISSG
jgi:hypothetical protein